MLAAHSDPMLDELCPNRSRCGLCGWLPQRHRAVDSAAGHLAAGDSAETVACELALSGEQVSAVIEWMAKWDGAWR